MPSFEEELAAGLNELVETAGRGFVCDGVEFGATLSLPTEDRGEFDVQGSHYLTRIHAQRASFVELPARGRNIVDVKTGIAYRIDEIPDVDPGDPEVVFVVQQLKRTA